MRRFRFLTPAEHRLAVLLLVLTLLGMIARGAEKLDPEVRAWLDTDPPREASGDLPDRRRPPEGDSTATGPVAAAGRELPTSPPGPRHPAGERLLDPNRASAMALEALPGIGPALAARIVAERIRGGPFREPADLLRVRGIGPATLERLRPFLDLEDPGP